MPPLEHNLTSILYALKATLESHLSQIEEGSTQKEERLSHVDEVLRKAYGQTNHALKVIKRLSCSPIENGTIRPLCARASVRKAWQQVLRFIGQEASLERIEIIERIPDRFPLIYCDRHDLKEIFYHLIKNALQAMDSRGRVALRVQLAFSIQEEPYAVIALSDTGPGIPERMLPNLFQPFFTTKPKGEGNGLGLYLIKSLVKRNRGNITVSSFEGCGATFALGFPLAKKST